MEDEPDAAEQTRPPLMGELVDSFRLAYPFMEDQTDIPGKRRRRSQLPPQTARRPRRMAGGVRLAKNLEVPNVVHVEVICRG
jgi:hypothetical protein